MREIPEEALSQLAKSGFSSQEIALLQNSALLIQHILATPLPIPDHPAPMVELEIPEGAEEQAMKEDEQRKQLRQAQYAVEGVRKALAALGLQMHMSNDHPLTRIVGNPHDRVGTDVYRKVVAERIGAYQAAREAYWRKIRDSGQWRREIAEYSRNSLRGCYASRCLLIAATLRDWRIVEVIDVLEHEKTLTTLTAAFA